MITKHKRLKVIFTGFIGGVLFTSLAILLIGLAAFGIEAIIRKLYHPSTYLWWFIIGAVFLLTIGGLMGVAASLLDNIFSSRRKK